MKTTTSTPAAKGYPVICASIMVSDIQAQMDFMEAVFAMEVKEVMRGADGIIHHAEMRLGDSVIMFGRKQSGFSCQAMNYVFVPDADATHKRALELGAVSIMDCGDRFYGFREGGFRDAEGHQWWIAHVVREIPQDEMEREAAKVMGAR
jgi:PhnB protein